MGRLAAKTLSPKDETHRLKKTRPAVERANSIDAAVTRQPVSLLRGDYEQFCGERRNNAIIHGQKSPPREWPKITSKAHGFGRHCSTRCA
jgi:hypothetical protein